MLWRWMHLPARDMIFNKTTSKLCSLLNLSPNVYGASRMHLECERPSAKEAIEALKVYQLRKENAVIFDEIKQLREDVARRKTDTNNIRQTLDVLKSKQAASVPQAHHPNTQNDAALEEIVGDIRSLRQE